MHQELYDCGKELISNDKIEIKNFRKSTEKRIANSGLSKQKNSRELV